MERVVITKAGRRIPLVNANPDYMRDPKSAVDIILWQINHKKIYDRYLGNRTDMVILDIGANIGLTALAFCDSAKRIVAVEAAPLQISIFKSLCANEKNIELVEAALSNENGTVRFYINENTTNSLFSHEGVTRIGFDVKSYSLDGLLKEYNLDKVDFCKMDIEGSEMIAVTKESLTAVYDRIDSIFLEVHSTHDDGDWKKDLVKNLNILRDIAHEVGYKTEEVDWEDANTPTSIYLYKQA
jgi:FkbM family methyltransferase